EDVLPRRRHGMQPEEGLPDGIERAGPDVPEDDAQRAEKRTARVCARAHRAKVGPVLRGFSASAREEAAGLVELQRRGLDRLADAVVEAGELVELVAERLRLHGIAAAHGEFDAAERKRAIRFEPLDRPNLLGFEAALRLGTRRRV